MSHKLHLRRKALLGAYDDARGLQVTALLVVNPDGRSVDQHMANALWLGCGETHSFTGKIVNLTDRAGRNGLEVEDGDVGHISGPEITPIRQPEDVRLQSGQSADGGLHAHQCPVPYPQSEEVRCLWCIAQLGHVCSSIGQAEGAPVVHQDLRHALGVIVGHDALDEEPEVRFSQGQIYQGEHRVDPPLLGDVGDGATLDVGLR